MVHKETKVTAAAYPRQQEWSTATGDDRLELVYNEYYHDAEPEDRVEERKRVNFVFAHPTGLCKEVWEVMIEQLFDAFAPQIGTVISIDAVNHAQSYRLNEGKLGWAPTWIDGARDIVALLRARQLLGDTILIGASMGATQCLYAAFLDPAHVDSVIAFDPVISHGTGRLEDTVERGKKRMKAVERTTLDHFESKHHFEEFLRKSPQFATLDPKVISSIKDHLVVPGPNGSLKYVTPTANQMDAYYTASYIFRDETKIVQSLDIEFLHVLGTEGRFTDKSGNEYLRATAKHCIPIDIEGGGHLVAFEKVEEAFEVVQEFVLHRLWRAGSRRDEIDRRKGLSVEARREIVADRLALVEQFFPNQPLYAKL